MTESPSVLIREAVIDDVEALVALLVGGTLSPEHEDLEGLAPYRAALAAIDADEQSMILVAELDGAVVGMGQLVFLRHLQHRGGLCAELESLHVASTLRGQGIGRQLHTRAPAIAAARGAYRLQLTSNVSRTDAHRLYESLGFAPTHRGFKMGLSSPIDTES